VSTLGGFIALCVIGIALGLLLGSRRTPVLLAAAPMASLLLGGLASLAAKELFGRDRPPITLRATTVGLASFPSAHATYAAAFFIAAALTLALTSARERWEKPVLLAGGAALAGLVGVSRLVLAVHWLSDVIAGWAVGTAVAVTVVMLAWYGTTRTASRRTDQPAVPT
jgi:undecaprenyl-diphosphatase